MPSALGPDSGPGRSVGVSLPVQDELAPADYVGLAARAEEYGFASVFLGEIAGTDAFALLGAIAARTERIRLGTGIVSLYSRSVPQLAMATATLDGLAPGRFVLGLGCSTRGVVEDWHGRSFHGSSGVPAVLEPLRRLLAGESVNLSDSPGPYRRFRLMPPSRHDVPVILAAIGPGMLQTAARCADGVYLAFCPVEETRQRIRIVHKAAERPVTSMLSVNAYAGPDLEGGMRRMREFLLRYFLLPTHRRGFGEADTTALEHAVQLWRDGARSQAIDAVPDRVVQRFAVVGSGSDVAERVRAYWAAGIDHVVLHVLGDGSPGGEASAGTCRAVSLALQASGLPSSQPATPVACSAPPGPARPAPPPSRAGGPAGSAARRRGTSVRTTGRHR
jgi:alkanesulfonate monooxygenase SsuD/methylene tetrahydromethanopterin reductase-like flavin-dependent oxidoreductase (luciferase family)